MRIVPKKPKVGLNKTDLDKIDPAKLDELSEEEYAALEAELEEMIHTGMEETMEAMASKVAAIVDDAVRKEIAANMIFDLELDMKIVQQATGLTKKELKALIKEITE